MIVRVAARTTMSYSSEGSLYLRANKQSEIKLGVTVPVYYYVRVVVVDVYEELG